MNDIYQKYWWIFTIRGTLTLWIGFTSLMLWPILSLGLIKIFFAPLIFVEGLLMMIIAFMVRREMRWLLLMIQGMAGLLIAALTFLLTTSITENILLDLIGIWIISGGILKLHILMGSGNPLKEHPLLVLSFLVLICLGVLIVTDHGSGLFGDVWIIGVVAAIQGIILLRLGFKFRSRRA